MRIEYCHEHPHAPGCVGGFFGYGYGGAASRFRYHYETWAAPRARHAPAPDQPAAPVRLPRPDSRARGQAGSTVAADRPRIVDTGYAFIPALNAEGDGYGLYTYAIITNRDQQRADAFVQAVTSMTASVSALSVPKPRINFLAIPGRPAAPSDSGSTGGGGSASAKAIEAAYDFDLARNLLDRICSTNLGDSESVCQGDMSQGPYLFTYGTKIGAATHLDPPYLMADLSNLHPKAFTTVLSAFKAQIKNGPLGGAEKIVDLRMHILNVVLEAADWLKPVNVAVAGIIHTQLPDANGKKKP